MVRDSQAFTVVEVMVAIVILTTGLLALTSAAGWSLRAMETGRRLTRATALAEQELAAFHGRPCGRSDGAGERTHGAYRLEWSVRGPLSRNEHVTVIVTTRHLRKERADTFSVMRPC